MINIPSIGIQIPDILLPVSNIDLQKWAVIACDQFTSEPEYWEEVKKYVGDSPSTYHIILPEVMLNTSEETSRIAQTQSNMRNYLSGGIFDEYHGFVLAERNMGLKTRHGLVLALDLECYDYHNNSKTLIRATEGTIIERLPPRIRIRAGAPLECPHILVLIDDPSYSVIEPIVKIKNDLQMIYDTDLMQNSGHLRGFLISSHLLEQQIIHALEKLADPIDFAKRYNTEFDPKVMLFAMGDGNHSLATAKSIWDSIKLKVDSDHPARYALVEIVNIHDPSIEFEPIHRVIFNVKNDFLPALNDHFGNRVELASIKNIRDINFGIQNSNIDFQKIGVITPKGNYEMRISQPDHILAVGSLQAFLDEWQIKEGFEKIDYVHGNEIVLKLGTTSGNMGFLLPAMKKSDLFKSVIHDGSLPRKTFSMGEAKEKRFYMECRQINR